MGFKKENYTLKGICVCVYFLLTTNYHYLNGQSHCPVRVDYEPREISQNRSANQIDEVKFPFFQQWEDLNNVRISDDENAYVNLPNNKRSTLFKGKNLGFSIPKGAKIMGIELLIEGHTSGEGVVEGQMVRLLNREGEAVGKNAALHALPTDHDWLRSNDSTDFIWRYGSSTDSWGLQLSENMINDIDFGYALQVRNKLNKPVLVSIDHIEMIVYYTPLYEVCSTHACVPFYIDESNDPLVSYEWYIPEGFELISDSEEDPAINIGVSYAEFGTYEICVESFYKGVSLGTCCRAFNYANCEPSQISGQVFYDGNNDSAQNNNEDGIEDFLINLYSDQGAFTASTFTDDEGRYVFPGLNPGQYYVEVVNPIDSLLFTTANMAPDDQDSDITGFFGAGTTDVISLQSGEELFNIDAGLILALTVGDFVWEDLNGDGEQQQNEPGIEDVSVDISNASGIISSTTTDSNGQYSFSRLRPGAYQIDFLLPTEYISTIPNNSDASSDSDYVPGEAISISYTVGGVIDSIDAGYFRTGTIGDFVWQDLNGDGLQDEDEPGIRDVSLTLKNSANETIQITTSDSLGQYIFENIVPGSYYIEVLPEFRFFPTAFEATGGTSTETDSDVFEQDDIFRSLAIEITSNKTDASIDFGFVEKPSTVGGFTFLDANSNGSYDPDEEFVSAIDVLLFNANDEQIDSTKTDSGGFYSFKDISAGTYYLVFALTQDNLFTIPDIGDDLADSDVTSSIIFGSTDLFELLPDEENFSFSAGYQVKPKIGDFVWLDANGNGIQDDDESGINDISIDLYNDEGELIQSVLSSSHPETGSPGFYQFSSLEPGKYFIKVPIDEMLDFAIVIEEAIGFNSSITNENGEGTSRTFNLVGNECNNDIDVGYAFKNGNISGEIWTDKNANGIQDQDEELIPGVFMQLFNEAGELLFFRVSNDEGKYFFNGLEAGRYYVVFDPSERYKFTDPLIGSDTTVDSDITGEFSVGSTSLIEVMDGITTEHIDAGFLDGVVDLQGYSWVDANGDGILQDNEDPLSNVQVDLYDLNDSLLATTLTDLNGNYIFEDNLEGQYYLVFTPENDSFINTPSNQGTDDTIDDDVTSFFSEGSTDTIDIVFFQDVASINAGYYQMSSIGDQVFIDGNENGINDDEPGLDGVIIQLFDAEGSVVTADTTVQGGGLDSGYYLLENIPPGVYTVQFTRPLFYQFVAADQGSDDSVDSDVAQVTNNTGTTNEIIITSGTTDLSIDAGVFFQIPMESSISGIVWNDANADGIRNDGEGPIPAIPLILEDQEGMELGMTTSDSEGRYMFENLTEGFYIVRATISADRSATYPDIGVDDTIDSDFLDADDEIKTASFFLATFEDLDHVDLGIVNTLRVGDFVWEDLNNNGVQDANEAGIEGIEISITSENGIISETLESGAEGAYQFDDLPAGVYKLCVTLPTNFNFAKPNIGTDLLDSDVDSTGCTTFLDFTSGGTVNDLDIGLTKNGSIEGVAFVDLNGNGVNNVTDPGLDGVLVELRSATGELLDTKTTSSLNDIPGSFEFKNLKATDYYLVFEYPEEYIITDPDIGDDMTDSDITGTFGAGSTDIFALPSGGIVTSVAGGAYLPASIGNEVWIDENEDGIRDENEEGIADIEVIIFRSFGIPFDTTHTDEEGFYQFENLKQGLYFIQFVIPQEYSISPIDQGTNDNVDSDADDTGKTPLISLAHGADLESIDCGIFASMASLRSVVWNDSNGDGMRQNQEARIPGIRISLYDEENNLMESTETNSLGLYAFQRIPEGDYKIYVDISDTNFAFTSMNMNDDDYHDSDINSTGESEIFSSDLELSILTVPNVDAGLFEGGGIVSNVWEDRNADGIYDIDESPLGNVEASLYSKDGQFIDKIYTTESEESVQFNNISPGQYYIRYDLDKEYVCSPVSEENTEDFNNDVLMFEGYYVTPVFQVLGNEVVSYIDAGFYKGSKVSTSIWFDTNENGIQDDEGELPTGIYASIFNQEGKSIRTKGINEEGQIHFTGIPKGKYYIKYYAIEALNFTQWIESSETNSDVNHSNGEGTTAMFQFDPYATYTHIDAGLLKWQSMSPELNSTMTVSKENVVRGSDIEKTEDLNFEVHPNPAANYLKINVDGKEAGGIISIHNNQNQRVFRGSVEGLDRIDLSNLHPGIYYVKYELNGKSKTRKILKIQ